jgi:hypothetical protein
MKQTLVVLAVALIALVGGVAYRLGQTAPQARVAMPASMEAEHLPPTPRDARAPVPTATAIERDFLSDGLLNDRVGMALRDPDFAAIVAEFEAANAGRTAAKTAGYRHLFDIAPGHEVVQLACGAALCMGALHAGSADADFPLQIAEQDALPVKAIEIHRIAGKGPGVDHRFVFTTQGVGAFVTGAPEG